MLLRYYATFQVRKFKSLFYKLNACLGPYPGLSLGTPVLRKFLDSFIQTIHCDAFKQNCVAHPVIHKVFISTFLSVLLKYLRTCRRICIEVIKWLMLFCISSPLIEHQYTDIWKPLDAPLMFAINYHLHWITGRANILCKHLIFTS